ncbi:MAG: EF-P lysine aminoacylase EpmA [Lentisphaeria bacterium]
MNNPDLQRLAALRPALRLRAGLTAYIRAFFRERGFLEVDTPVRLATPALEEFIDAEPAGSGWLRTSPELHLKRLLAAGYDRLFQLGPCFRQGERGRLHQPEFAMLEWYRGGADYEAILADTRALVAGAAHTLLGRTVIERGGRPCDLAAAWDDWTVDAAFEQFAGLGVETVLAQGDGAFETRLVETIEPHLGHDRPAILRDYPLAFGALARRKPGRPDRAERWELYIAGIEIANAYSELTDAAEQRRRFLACAERRRREGRAVYPLDEPFLAALEAGLPPCGGIALGFDRLLLLLAGADRLDDVLPFPA